MSLSVQQEHASKRGTMAGEVPLLKLIFLGVRQISKPIANRFRASARESEVFRAAWIAVGRALHRGQIQLSRVAAGKGALAHITPLNEAAAVNWGAEFRSEMIVYGIAGATIVYECRGQQLERERKKEEAAAVEEARRRGIKENEEKVWAELRAANRRITLLDEQLWAARQAQAEEEARARARRETAEARQRGGGWARWLLGRGGGAASDPGL